jgi:phosphatidylserine/phosphatidylglycerophosphate/cardiolipin synthase-like enzyme
MRAMIERKDPEAGLQNDSIFSPGSNCLKVASADRVSVLVDGCSYFEQLESALRAAECSILILGWDFDGRIRLRPQLSDEVSPPIGRLLRQLVEQKPALEVYVLVWSVSVLHGPSAILPSLFGAEWEEHPRIRVKLDMAHPIEGAHHQKIVCIDGKLAFVGGMDLTVRRWDTPEHRIDDPLRVDIDGSPYPPVHDVQILVDGQAATVMCGLAHDRWREATCEERPAGRPSAGNDPWPPGLMPDFRNVSIAIARTVPEYGRREETCEIGVMTVDMIEAARHSIYVEAQYMTAESIGDALVRRLGEPEGPEVIVVMTLESRGIVERIAMSNNRDALIRRLVRADAFDRLRVLYPVVPDADGRENQVLVHAKLMIVDDMLLRVGSANLNNRSIGLDTECDLAVEARTQIDREGIAAIRNRLLGEHLGCEPHDVAAAVGEHGSLLAAIDRLNVRARGLRPFSAMTEDGPSRPGFAAQLLDPIRPFRLSSLFE